MVKKKTRRKAPAEIYELNIVLLNIEPTIWRRFAVPSDITLAGLHDVIQFVMGWTDSHLHQFVVEDRRYGMPELLEDPDMLDEGKVKLRDVTHGSGATFIYEYDFGDGWKHRLDVLKIGPPDPDVQYPICLDGERQCPPEDCGGVPGYFEMIEILADPEHEEHESMLEWLGGSFDPKEFDQEDINALFSNGI